MKGPLENFGELEPSMGAQVTFQGLRPLEKFGRFGDIENVDQRSETNVIIAEEHDVQAQIAGHEDERVNPEIEVNPGEDVVVEIIDQEFDSTLNEAEQRLEIDDAVKVVQEKEAESHRVVRDARKGKEVDVALVTVHTLQERVFALGLQLDDQVLQSETKDILNRKGDAGPSGTVSDKNQESGTRKGEAGSSHQEYDKLLFDIDDLLEENVEVTEVRDTGKRKKSSSAEYDYSNVDKWVDGKRIDTSERLIIPSVRHKDYFKQQQDLPESMLSQLEEIITIRWVTDLEFITGTMMETSECGWLKRKSGNLEYYESPLDFESWTRVDLVELDEAPFFNRPNDPRGREFYDFLHEEVCLNFKRMKTDESTVKKHKGVEESRTGKTFTSICWPPTNKLKSIPIPHRFPDGCLSKFVMWAIDSKSSEAVINCGDHEYQILYKIDLLRFGEHDIKILAMHQIKTDPVFEVHGIDFTSLAASIVRTKLWACSKVMQTLPTKP
ncbi:hypothetical protein R6Q59_035689 [Mikania micrantha]